jgi:uncharacterized protein (DUF2342 family)
MSFDDFINSNFGDFFDNGEFDDFLNSADGFDFSELSSRLPGALGNDMFFGVNDGGEDEMDIMSSLLGIDPSSKSQSFEIDNKEVARIFEDTRENSMMNSEEDAEVLDKDKSLKKITNVLKSASTDDYADNSKLSSMLIKNIQNTKNYDNSSERKIPISTFSAPLRAKLNKYIHFDKGLKLDIRNVSKNEFLNSIANSLIHYTFSNMDSEATMEDLFNNKQVPINSMFAMKFDNHFAILNNEIDNPIKVIRNLTSSIKLDSLKPLVSELSDEVTSNHILGIELGNNESRILLSNVVRASEVSGATIENTLSWVIARELVYTYIYTKHPWVKIKIDKLLKEHNDFGKKYVSSKVQKHFSNPFNSKVGNIDKIVNKANEISIPKFHLSVLLCFIDSLANCLSYKILEKQGSDNGKLFSYFKNQSIKLARIDGLLHKITGISIKTSHILAGYKFWDFIDEFYNLDLLNTVFEHPHNLPELNELANIDSYVSRISKSDDIITSTDMELLQLLNTNK